MRKRAVLLLLLLLTGCFFLSGCWDIKTIQGVNYVTALGIDYADGQYTVYTQLINFASTSKQEGAQISKTEQWVGKGKGVSVLEAINDMYQASQQPTMWSHVIAVVLSERVLDKGIAEIKDSLFRFREIRYVPWAFGTSEPIDSLFSQTGMFGKPAIHTVLEEPQNITKQLSWFRPVRLQQLVYTAQEPAGTIMLPCITVAKRTWSEKGRPQELLTVNGAYALYKGENKGYFPNESLKGLVWTNPKTTRYSVAVKREGQFVGTVSLAKPKIQIVRRFEKGVPRLSISVSVKGYLSEQMQPIAPDELSKLASQTIERDIRATYGAGMLKKTDLFSLEEEVYRKNIRFWKTWENAGNSPLKADNLEKVTVRIKIKHSGTYRMEEAE